MRQDKKDFCKKEQSHSAKLDLVTTTKQICNKKHRRKEAHHNVIVTVILQQVIGAERTWQPEIAGNWISQAVHTAPIARDSLHKL